MGLAESHRWGNSGTSYFVKFLDLLCNGDEWNETSILVGSVLGEICLRIFQVLTIHLTSLHKRLTLRIRTAIPKSYSNPTRISLAWPPRTTSSKHFFCRRNYNPWGKQIN